MRLLVLTNLYPPQELGGYGRSMADFAWGLQERGHQLHVLSSDAPYLGPGAAIGPSGESVKRLLTLRGSYQGGIQNLQDPARCHAIDQANVSAIQAVLQCDGPFDGALIGNLDLLGPAPLLPLLAARIPVLHHIGFVTPPFHPSSMPTSPHYQLVAASVAVRRGLEQAGLATNQCGTIPVVYPGVRTDLFGLAATGRRLPPPLDGMDPAPAAPLGSAAKPLRVCFAGLLMGSKGAHTLVEALVLLRKQGIHLQGHLAGGAFQPGYREQLEALLQANHLDDVRFVGQLKREALARFFRLHHVCVFPSIHPEAFGIVGAEAMASGLALVSSGVGGAAEVLANNDCGLLFAPGNPAQLASRLQLLCSQPSLLKAIAKTGMERAISSLSVKESAKQLEELLLKNSALP